MWLLPAMAAPTARPIYVSRIRKDAGPGFHFVSPRPLQLTVLRHRPNRGSDEPAAMCPECGCTFGVGCSTLRLHHASATGTGFVVGWISRWPPWSTCHCPAWLQPIYPPTVSWSPTKNVRWETNLQATATIAYMETFAATGPKLNVAQPYRWTATSWY